MFRLRVKRIFFISKRDGLMILNVLCEDNYVKY